jgi:transposase-like protein
VTKRRALCLVVSAVRRGVRATSSAPSGSEGGTWHLDELFATIQGRRQHPWCAVDEGGDVSDILVQSRRNPLAFVEGDAVSCAC